MQLHSLTVTLMKFAALLLFLSGSVSASEQPNIVLYIADDHGRNDSSVYDSDSQAITPNMAKLASEGMTFNNAFVASPACGPSRAALMSGLMPAKNRAEHNHERPKANTQTMVSHMQDAGYEVAFFGKVQHSNWYTMPGSIPDHNDRPVKNLEKNVRTYLKDRSSRKPLLLIVGDTRTHTPWLSHKTYKDIELVIPKRWVDTPDTRRLWENYLGEVTAVDTTVGSIDRIARNHFGSDDFLYIYTSDHGHAWPFGKWNLYDWGTQVGFHARWPGKIKANTRTNAMVSWIDIFPTLLDIAGHDPVKGIDGKSFAQVLTGEATEHRDLIFTTHSGAKKSNVYPIRSVRDKRFKYIRNLYPDHWYTNTIDMVRNEKLGAYFTEWEIAAKTQPHAKAVLDKHHRRPAVEFYDVAVDPEETHNLANDPEYAIEVDRMGNLLSNWMSANGDTVRMQHDPYPLSGPYPGPSSAR